MSTVKPARPNEPRALWKKVVPVAALFLLVAVVAVRLVGPPCPKHLVIATGNSDGAYYGFAQRYAELLAQHGITLEVRQTAGSIENLELLRTTDSGVSLAIVQGGAETQAGEAVALSLASLYPEPVWVFYRSNVALSCLTELRGATIAVGPQGSGTRALAMKLLGSNGLLDGDATVRTAAWGGRDAVRALRSGEVDAAMFVVSPQSPVIDELLQADGVRLMSLRRAEAYPATYPYVSKVTLHEGVLDLQQNVPAKSIDLLATNANLVARSDVHPALVPLLLETAREVHASAGVFAGPDAYPSPHGVCLPLLGAARRHFASGPSLLYRVAPFRVAAWLDRMKILLLPLCTLLLPFAKALPPLYRWRIRQKIYRWYRVLRDVDARLRHADERTDFSADVETLEKLDLELTEVSVPLSYMEEFYNLRLHVSFMLERLKKRAVKVSRAPRRAA